MLLCSFVDFFLPSFFIIDTMFKKESAGFLTLFGELILKAIIRKKTKFPV